MVDAQSGLEIFGLALGILLISIVFDFAGLISRIGDD